MFRHSIENIMREVQTKREKELEDWLEENRVKQLSLEEGEKLFNELLGMRGVSDAMLHSMKVDFLASRLDYQLNPDGIRQLSRAEESANDFMNFIGSLELMDRMSDRIK